MSKKRLNDYTILCNGDDVPVPVLLPPSCPPKAPLSDRSLLSGDKASELARLFDVLASGTRLRLLHALILLGDPCMSDLAGAVDMKLQAVSNQLRRLVDLGILATRRQGSHVHYHIADDCVIRLLYHGLCLNEEVRKIANGSLVMTGSPEVTR